MPRARRRALSRSNDRRSDSRCSRSERFRSEAAEAAGLFRESCGCRSSKPNTKKTEPLQKTAPRFVVGLHLVVTLPMRRRRRHQRFRRVTRQSSLIGEVSQSVDNRKIAASAWGRALPCLDRRTQVVRYLRRAVSRLEACGDSSGNWCCSMLPMRSGSTRCAPRWRFPSRPARPHFRNPRRITCASSGLPWSNR